MRSKKYEAQYARIIELKGKHDVLILAHYYQRPEIQEIADYVGDSFGLSQTAAKTEAKIIAFCGVHFMAESAAILSPNKDVILPEPNAGCPMADMADVKGLRALKQQHPDAAVVSYVNTTAAIKAESDICCTSSNAVKVIQSLKNHDKIIFVPDRNLGSYVAKFTNKEIILWEGFCNTHDCLSAQDVKKAKEEHPKAKVIVHPECLPEVVAMADFVSSTAGMLRYVSTNSAEEFIVGTERGLMHAMQKDNPEKRFYLAAKTLICPNMKLTTLDKLENSLKRLEPVIKVDSDIAQKAKRALERMLAVQ